MEKMDISSDLAGSLLVALADDLTALLHARGYPQAHAEIWIGRHRAGPERRVLVHLADAPGFVGGRASVTEAVAAARAEIEKLPDLKAYAAWFEPVPTLAAAE